MEWRDLATIVGRTAPILGSLLGGPAGGAVGTVIASVLGVGNSPDNVSQALTINPDAAVKLSEIEATRTIELQKLIFQTEAAKLAASTAEIQAVNATMVAESKAEHWPTYMWRPFCGFVFGTMFFGVYFVLPLMKTPVPDVPTEAWLAIGAVLGVASWHRGAMQNNPAIPTVNKG